MQNTIMPRKTVQPPPIPPEGDAYNAQRQEELYAAITNKAQLQRRFATLTQEGASAEQIQAVTEAIAQAERDISRIGRELDVSSQGANLNIFLVRLDESLERKDTKDEERHRKEMDGLAGVGTRLGKIEETLVAQDDRIGTLEERAGQTEARELARDERVTAVEHRIEAAESRITANELAQRELEAAHQSLEREHRQLVSRLSRDTKLLELLNQESGGAE